MEQMLQARVKPSPDNLGPYVVLTSYILMSVMVLTIIARLRPGRNVFSATLRVDECLLLLAMVTERSLSQANAEEWVVGLLMPKTDHCHY